MKRSISLLHLPSILLLSSILAPVHTSAAGMITRLVASPNPATVGQEVIISLEGKGACQEVFLQLGEGSGLRVLTRVDFEKGRNVSAPAQVFTVAKNYPLKAIAGRGCVGAAAVYLAVLPQGPPKKPAPKPTR